MRDGEATSEPGGSIGPASLRELPRQLTARHPDALGTAGRAIRLPNPLPSPALAPPRNAIVDGRFHARGPPAASPRSLRARPPPPSRARRPEASVEHARSAPSRAVTYPPRCCTPQLRPPRRSANPRRSAAAAPKRQPVRPVRAAPVQRAPPPVIICSRRRARVIFARAFRRRGRTFEPPSPSPSPGACACACAPSASPPPEGTAPRVGVGG